MSEWTEQEIDLLKEVYNYQTKKEILKIFKDHQYCEIMEKVHEVIDFKIQDWYDCRIEIFKNNWSLQEIEWLYENYIKTGKQDLILKFGKPYKTITNVIEQIGIRKFNKSTDWTEDELKILKENYANTLLDDLKVMIPKRTVVAMRKQAGAMGIYRDEDIIFKETSLAHMGFIMPEETKIKLSRSNKGRITNGLTPLVVFFRCSLYEWKIESLKKYDYKCAFTRINNKTIEIHHVNKNFSEIIQETMTILGIEIKDNVEKYSAEEIKLMQDKFLELNFKHGLGVPICKYIHRLFHTIYGLKNNTKEQFDDFELNYKNGIYNESLQNQLYNYDVKKIKHKTKRLSESDVIEIRELINRGFQTAYIANKFKTGIQAISNIKICKSWQNIK